MPDDWRGTTFKNSNLLGREGFAANFHELIQRKLSSGESISTSDLVAIGNAEDYLRVATNVSTTLEIALAAERGYEVSQVFTFASKTMPIISVLLTVSKPVHLYLGGAASPFSAHHHRLLELLGCRLVCHAGAPMPRSGDEVILALDSSLVDATTVDGIVGNNILYICNPQRIAPTEILVIRKRMATPMTTPVAEAEMQRLAGVTITADRERADEPSIADFLSHLQQLCGTVVDADHEPVVFTAGLSALCAMWLALVEQGGADILMCSTAYGGSSQLTDIINAKAGGLLRKHMFHIQGASSSIVNSIREQLDVLARRRDLLPTTVLFVEVPTNPDQKVPDLAGLTDAVRQYTAQTGREVVLLVDTTFTPGSEIFHKFAQLAPDLAVLVFISMSKSVSRGITTAGAIVANHTAQAQELLEGVRSVSVMLDTSARDDQLLALARNHWGVEERCERAYNVAVAAGEALTHAVRTHSSQDMYLNFVTEEQAAAGFLSATYSFNLPSTPAMTEEIKAALAQRFVDLICAHPQFKPCVSFGQDNGLVYATVPATSTQGAIKAEDKAKQAVGGVQLVRLSFPPTCDLDGICRVLADAAYQIYRK
jgi:cysteine synthase A